MSICDDWGVPQDGCQFILYYSFRFVLVPTGWLPVHSLLLVQVCVGTSIGLPLECCSVYICLGEAEQLLGCAC